MNPLTLKLGEATESLARVQATLSESCDATITGTFIGPRCPYARTLPAVFPIRADGEILITDPCYWTADLPFQYDLQLEVRKGDHIVNRIQQSIGLKRLNARGKHLFVEGRMFVFRAARFGNDRTPDWAAYREERLAMYIVDPHDELCEAASEQGVWIIAECRDSVAQFPGMCHPAVAIVVVSQKNLTNVERLPGGPLIGVRAENRESIANASADVIIYDVNDVATAKHDLAGCTQPAITVRFEENHGALAEARSACEQLQRELTPELNLAGYVV